MADSAAETRDVTYICEARKRQIENAMVVVALAIWCQAPIDSSPSRQLPIQKQNGGLSFRHSGEIGALPGANPSRAAPSWLGLHVAPRPALRMGYASDQLARLACRADYLRRATTIATASSRQCKSSQRRLSNSDFFASYSLSVRMLFLCSSASFSISETISSC